MRIKVYIKKYIAFVLCLAFLSAGLLFRWISVSIGNNLLDQNVAKSYGQDIEYTQLTLYTSSISGFGKNSIPEIRSEIKKAIKENVVSDDIAGRSFIDAYSTIGKLDVSSQKSAGSLQIYAVSGDFFLFHPMTFTSGSYFSDESDENSDGIVLNELGAWQLFGATDVTGMLVEVGDISMPVRGVVKDIDTRFSKASGENIPRAYLSYEKYIEAIKSGEADQLSPTPSMFCYEALIINPVKDFAINTVRTIVETNLKLNEDTFEYVINSQRFSLFNRLLLIKNFFNRVMNKTGVVYPYWENYARAKEQVIMLLTILELLFFIASIVFFIIGVVGLRPEFQRLKNFTHKKSEDLAEFVKEKTRKKDAKVEEKK